jgi:hypothetical protein
MYLQTGKVKKRVVMRNYGDPKNGNYIKGKSVPTLRKWVLPHIHSSMRYKLGL